MLRTIRQSATWAQNMVPEGVVCIRHTIEGHPSRLNRVVGFLLLIGCLVTLPACTDRRSLEGDRHPRPDLIVLAPGVEPTAVRLEGESTDSSRRGLKVSLRATLGALSEASGHVFGEIEDLEFVDDSTLAIVDSRSNQVVLSEVGGSRVRALGAPGEGPNEFQYPNAVTVLSPSEILISDSRGRGISLVNRSDSGWAITEKIQIDLLPLDICSNDATVYVHGFRMDGSGRVLHVYDHDLNLENSFGGVYEGPDPSINRNLSRGHISCVPDGVLYASEGLGEVRRYSTSGELEWATRFDGFRAIPYIRLEEEGRTLNPIPEAGGQFIVSLETIGQDAVLVQTATVTREGREEGRRFDGLETYLLSSTDGRLIARINEFEWIVEGASRGTLVGARSDPYPQVGVFRAQFGPGAGQ